MLQFFVNGRRHILREFDPRMTLAGYLRSEKNKLLGTKIADHTGVTGADTVMMSRYNTQTSKVENKAVLSNVLPLAACNNASIITIEGIGNLEAMHPIQKRWTDVDAAQCGFCAAGMIMSVYTQLSNNPKPSAQDLEECLDGNLCRCTGYRPISAAVAAFATDAPQEAVERWTKRAPEFKAQEWDPSTEPEFPHTLIRDSYPEFTYEHVDFNEQTGDEFKSDEWHAPDTLTKLLEEAAKPNAKLVGGNTYTPMDCLTPSSFTDADKRVFVLTNMVAELRKLSVESNGSATFGGAVTISEIRDALEKSDYQPLRILSSETKFYRSTQLRNMSTIGGEIAENNKYSDVVLYLTALNASVCVHSKLAGIRTIPLEKLTSGELSLTQGDVVVSVTIPPMEGSIGYLRRLAPRRHLINPYIVMAVLFKRDGCRFFVNSIGKGAAHRLTTVESTLGNHIAEGTLTESVFAKAVELASQDLPVSEEDIKKDPGARDRHVASRVEHQRALAGSLVRKAVWYYITQHKEAELPQMWKLLPTTDLEELALLPEHTKTLPFTIRDFPESQHKVVGQYHIQQTTASKNTGDARFPIDCTVDNMSYAALVYSTRPKANIKKVDVSKALEVPGVIDYADVNDIPGANIHSGILPVDTLVFTEGVSNHIGHNIGIITAETEQIARYAASLVEITYEDLPNPLLSIEDAIAANSYHPLCGVGERVLEMGDVEKVFEKYGDKVIKGQFFLGGQDHTYMETNSTTIYPDQDGRIICTTSTQNPSKVQWDIANVLNVKANKVECYLQHIGGGFGGKQDRPAVFATAAAVIMNKTKRPVKLTLTREEDMILSGGRHPFLVEYRAAVNPETKKIEALHNILTSDGGWEYDVTAAVLDKATFQSTSTYTIGNCKIEGRSAKTNRVTNTAYRGFGAPQATILIENVMDRLCRTLDCDPTEFREINLNKPGDQNITGTYLATRFAEDIPRRCWNEIITTSDFYKRREAVEEFNKKHTLRKRGIAVMPLKNAGCFEEAWMNQAVAVVNMYRDGTVLVHHSGVEMGQGIHTKMAQIAAEVLEVPLENITVSNTSTNVCPNTQPTSASSGIDVNGPAVRDAAQQIKDRLDKVRSGMDNGAEADIAAVCNTAYFTQVDLRGSAHFTLPSNCQWFWEKKEGVTGYYYAYGAAVAEVEVDIATGDWKCLRMDLIEDCGAPLNPNFEAGQVEGGTTQGIGLFTIEEIAWDEKTGEQITDNLGDYAIPGLTDVPTEIHCALLKDSPIEGTIYNAKAAEEAPVLLATSVFLALKEVVYQVRRERGLDNGYVQIDSPITHAKLLKALKSSE